MSHGFPGESFVVNGTCPIDKDFPDNDAVRLYCLFEYICVLLIILPVCSGPA